ncbi:hypothetical protein CFC21_008376 [Triticum aestivum]|uniref:Uncharacterized protein n=3 Tax=Triticum TaxID=4564 RepID=A0A9R0R426_TRITD|nr:uncharacterized protein LOC123141526 [Triticum aestivum]KAF6991273.1 hypothetical protein CFC21_008376 [Triticum aestivum]VAH21582.1 unnamed protein product [Triticum turgidum subsp. durum]
MEISLDALLGVQRHGQDLADRLAQGVSGLLLHLHAQPPQLPWPAPLKLVPFDIELPAAGVDLPAVAVASFVEIGGRLGQAGSELGASVGGAVQQLSRQIPVPFRARRRKWDGASAPPTPAAAVDEGEAGLARERAAEGGMALEGVGEGGSLEEVAAAVAAATGSAAAARAVGAGAEGADGSDEEEDGFEFEIGTLGKFMKPQGTVNVSATYNTWHHTVDSSVVARGDFWRLESSRGGSTNGNNSAPGFLIQLGPLLFVRDSTTLLLPINLSKQHLIWYAYDHKNGVHSLCPVVWSKQKKWLLMSMMCLNPVACAFMDVEFSNGQLRYVAGEGITASGFFPLFGGLLQAHGKFPGETKLGFSFKSTQGTWFTPTYQWPDNSLSFGVAHAIAWKKSGLMMRPGTQVSVCPTLGGSDPGIRAEIVHSLKEEIGVSCGFSCSRHPSAFTSLSIGRSKLNGEVGSSGVVVTMEKPLDNMGSPSLSVQLNGGLEF